MVSKCLKKSINLFRFTNNIHAVYFFSGLALSQLSWSNSTIQLNQTEKLSDINSNSIDSFCIDPTDTNILYMVTDGARLSRCHVSQNMCHYMGSFSK